MRVLRQVFHDGFWAVRHARQKSQVEKGNQPLPSQTSQVMISPVFSLVINTPDINVPSIVLLMLPSKPYFYWTETLTTWAGTSWTYWWTPAEVLSIY